MDDLSDRLKECAAAVYVATQADVAKDISSLLLEAVDQMDWQNDEPGIDDFMSAVTSEMKHQRKRWGKDHDTSKGIFDWIALSVRLQGKMVEAVWNGDKDKFLHHVITLAAVMGNCHAAQISKQSVLLDVPVSNDEN